MEILKSDEQQDERLKKNEQSLRVLWYQWVDQYMHSGHMHLKEKAERLSKEIMAKNFPNLMKDINVQKAY